MSRRGKNDSPWRHSAISAHGAPVPSSRIAGPRSDIRQARENVQEYPDALNLDSIAGQLAQALQRVNDPKHCKNKFCGRKLSTWNTDESGLCFACQIHTRNQVRKHRKSGARLSLKALDLCGCGRALPTNGAKICGHCLEEQSNVLKGSVSFEGVPA